MGQQSIDAILAPQPLIVDGLVVVAVVGVDSAMATVYELMAVFDITLLPWPNFATFSPASR